MNLIQATLQLSRKFERKIILFRYSERAWELLATIATGKPRIITLKTAREGELQGFIPVDENVPLPDGYSLEKYNNKDVLTYNGNFITSDLDIFWIERKKKEELFFDREFGYLTVLEKKVIEELNATFREFSRRNVTLVTHGPYFNLKKPRKSDIVFPYDAFHPVLGYQELKSEAELKNFSIELTAIDKWDE